jgi:serine/threonine-protein kinase RsbW
MHAEVRMHLAGATNQLRIIWQTGETLLESVPFEGEDAATVRYNVLLAIQELVTNVYRHAYGGDLERGIDVHFRTSARGFEAEIVDDGPNFDPTRVPERFESPNDEMPADEGGFGIMITRAVMDDLHYERLGERNVVRVFKSAREQVRVED